MRSARWRMVALSVAALTACSSDESAPTEPRLPEAPSLSKNAGAKKISARGRGVVDLSTAGVGDAHFSFHASVKPNGKVEGRFRQRRERNGLVIDFSGKVTCLTVDAALGRARIAGVITENNSTDPAFMTENHQVGDDVWFRVQDSDVGGGAVEASTTYGFKPTLVNTSAEYCALPFTGLPAWNPATTFPLKSGKIKVDP